MAASTDSTTEKVAHKLGIAWPSAEEGLLRQAADACEAAARSLEEQKDTCTGKVRGLTAGNTGGGMEQFASFWGRYDGRGGALPVTAQACRQLAGGLREYADEVQKTKDSIRHKVEIAGAALVVGAVAAVFTLATSEVVAAAAALALADFAAAAGVALSATAVAIVSTALTGAAFGAVESVAVDALVVQPLSAALGEQKHFSFGELLHAGEFGAAGGLLAGSAGGALARLPAVAGAAEAGGLPRLASTLDGLTSFTGSTGGRLATNGLIGAGTTEALSGGHATGFDTVLGTVGGMASPGGRRRMLGRGTRPDGSWAGEGLALTREDNTVATRAYTLAQGREPRVTADLQHIAGQTPGGLERLKMRLKSPDSYRRKIATAITDGASPAQAASKVRDAVRYTFQLPDDNYVRGVNQVTAELLQRGYLPVPDRFNVTWSGPVYRGINSSWVDPRTGQLFEVQFHTEQSLQAAEVTHGLYEEQRLPGTSDQRVAELQELQGQIFAMVPVPPGLAEIVVPQMEMRP